MSDQKKTALVLVANGTEEMEAVIAIDVLRRAGVAVTVAGVDGDGEVKCARETRLTPDQALAKTDGQLFDVIVLPGGLGGADVFCKSALVGARLKEHADAGRLVAAICAAPTALATHGIAKSETVTSFPSVRDKLEQAGYKYSEERVVVSNKTITSRGPGTAFEFALELVAQLVGSETAAKLKEGMLVK